MIHLLFGAKGLFLRGYLYIYIYTYDTLVLGECIDLYTRILLLNSENKKQKKMEGRFYHWPSIIERRFVLVVGPMVGMDRFLDFYVVMCLPRWGKQNLWLFLSSVKIVVRRCWDQTFTSFSDKCGCTYVCNICLATVIRCKSRWWWSLFYDAVLMIDVFCTIPWWWDAKKSLDKNSNIYPSFLP